mgnify:FL=1
MRTIYFDCFSGISGDMCLGALVDCGVPLGKIRAALDRLPVDGYRLEANKVRRAGLSATKVDVVLDEEHDHPHRGLHDVLEIIYAGELKPAVQHQACAVFRNLAEAEARVHDTDPDSVHFHEVGAVDAICDIVGTVVGLHHLDLDRVLFSTISVGGGTIQAAHGMLPVPAPATVELLKGLPTSGGPLEMELTTPTGAALIKTLGKPLPRWPAMQVLNVGHGAGGHNPEKVPNVLRVAVGASDPEEKKESDHVWCLETNLDDMTGEDIGFCSRLLMAEGALDVYATPIQMKKDRPATKLTVLCQTADLGEMKRLLFRHTTTLGIRRMLMQRSKLPRTTESVETPWGEVRLKVGQTGRNERRAEPEYEDCARIAREDDLPLRTVQREARAAWQRDESGGGEDQD